MVNREVNLCRRHKRRMNKVEEHTMLGGMGSSIVDHLVLIRNKELDQWENKKRVLSAENVKALFRRGRAHAAVWNVKEAREDLERAAQLDPSVATAVRSQLSGLDTAVKERDAQDRERLQGKIF
ncbi:Aryl-hydrocarbon-interacting protein-like 1 [Homalodisca vitripennis]|nr:Aryl-hydrocarbon-interacting protein-like 1 [Homalodisca vitripennis]